MADQKKKSGIKPKLQKAKAKFFSTYYSNPAKDVKIIAVTGNSGRSIVALYVQNILKNKDQKTGLIVDPKTTSDLYKRLYKIWRTGANYAVVSVDSTGLANHLFYGLPIFIAILTDTAEQKTAVNSVFSSNINGTSPEDAKAILFNTQPYFSILNRDDVNYNLFAKYPAKTATLSYGHSQDANLVVNRFKPYKMGTEANVSFGNLKFDIATYITGEEAVHYMSAATLAGLALDIDKDLIVDSIADYEPKK